MRAARWLRALALLLVVFFGGLLSYSLIALLDLQEELAEDLGENMVWAAGQATYQASLLLQASQLPSEGHRGNAALQRHLLRARLEVLLSPSQANFMQRAGVLEQLQQARNQLGEADVDHAAMQALLHDIGRKIMQVEREQAGERRDVYKRLMHQLILSILCVMAAGGGLCWQLLRSMWASQRAHDQIAEQHRHTRKLLSDLEHERSVRLRYRDFVSLMSHQLRTPLSVIDSSAQRLMRQSESESGPVAERSQRIRSSVGQLNRLVGRLLDGLRLDETGTLVQSSLVLSRCLWRDIVGEAIERFADTLAGRQVQQEWALECEGQLLCDRLWSVEILVNLLSNAHKYSPPDQPILIRVWRRDSWLYCAVRDFGTGVPEAEHAQIFERFYRSAGTQHLSGVGLGLPIARTLAQWQGGSLSVRNAEDGGAVFTLALPIGSGDDDIAQSTALVLPA
ncbi:sensor histidine kinase KdpD [Pseudomonas sp. o96-267]|uniref:sensor histidine kinase n=1 Tax=Pseudomonas sp. o96-267 TaxID=2479853 RepID=UPI000F786266|nr:HAMP domain-containing sensor histidine kinase [Pseudomonas sp. o96-267]